LVLIARFHGIAADYEQIRHSSGGGHARLAEADLAQAARRLGLTTRIVTVSGDRLAMTPCPALILAVSGEHRILVGADSIKAMVLDPFGSAPRHETPDEVKSACGGRLMLFASRASAAARMGRFDFTWFVPAIVKYRRLLSEVLLVSMALQLLGLVTPLMFQVVMDKVLVNRAFGTLAVVCVTLTLCTVFETLLTGLRNYVFAHTTNRIDVELGARLYRHLLELPARYFGLRRVGDTVARVRELENIRNFLTSNAITAVLDLFFSIIFLSVMLLYSGWLTLIVVVSLPVYALVSITMNPLLRQRLDEKFARGADNQAFLVESVSAIETVKAMAIEPQFVRRWDNQLAAYVTAGFRASNLGNIGQQLIQLVGKLVNVAILGMGAKLVIDGRLSVGQLIAFNMMSQRVSSPVLRLAQLWQDFQQAGISMQRLADILDTPIDSPQSKQTPPPIRGHIQMTDVAFRYRDRAPLVLCGATLEIQAGQVVGIVGRSGSGKSTLARLIQRMYLPEAGRVQIDGIDLSLADPAWLRRQIGVVLQENVLFNGSIRENIAITDPGAPLQAVMQAATLAGAHEFISEFPEGYDTMVGEHGASLSGGQRQRIAIARALLSNPRVLIFDEATSALDFETEHVIRRNMAAICRGRTVVVIAHRLSAVRDAHRIFVMEKGRVVEDGTHEQLLRRGGRYAHLASLQNA
jgi:subfamily B ATP-binding cassette protein HlyB/CyaB